LDGGLEGIAAPVKLGGIEGLEGGEIGTLGVLAIEGHGVSGSHHRERENGRILEAD
jgi:hypothetical protein